MLDELSFPGEFNLRPIESQDQPFVKQLFRSVRPHLALPGLPTDVVEALITQQYQLQQNHYATQWPTASSFIILLANGAIGKIVLNEGKQSLHIIDLALMPEHRGKGVGTALLRTIQAVADKNGASVGLSVDKQNSLAKKLYLSLGFRVRDTSDTHESMIFVPNPNFAC